jgi:hypothetical protein
MSFRDATAERVPPPNPQPAAADPGRRCKCLKTYTNTSETQNVMQVTKRGNNLRENINRNGALCRPKSQRPALVARPYSQWLCRIAAEAWVG